MDLTSSEPPSPETKTHRTLHPALVQLTGMHLVGGHGRTSGGGEIVAISLGSACLILVVGALVYWAWKLVKRRRATNSEYEKILPSKQQAKPQQHPVHHVVAGDKQQVHPEKSSGPTLSMRTIPFTVPSTGSRPRPGDQRLVEEGSTSVTSGSEPSTPSTAPTTRGSMDSLSSAAGDNSFRGAYALGTIDPSLYKMADVYDDYEYPDDHVGRLWFAVEYENEAEKLTVTLIKAKNLPSRVLGNTNGCDPFVRIYLMPDERRYLQSKFKKKTCNPKFEESFVFQVSSKSMEERVLRLTVYDVDRHKKHQVIGHALYPLKAHAHDDNERVVIWRDLEREVSETTSEEKGELHIALSYNNNMERLTVGIFDGKNFKKTESPSRAGDYYVKVCFLLQNKPQKTKKTDVVRKSNSPTFHESFNFKLPANSLDTASVTITAMQSLTTSKDKPVGRVVLGSFMFVRGKELEHWNEMAANQRETINMWHTLT